MGPRPPGGGRSMGEFGPSEGVVDFLGATTPARRAPPRVIEHGVGQWGVGAYCSELGQRQGPAQGISALPSASTGYGKYTRNFSAQKGSGPCDATSSGVHPVHLTWFPSAS